jgi:hypothetical protein
VLSFDGLTTSVSAKAARCAMDKQTNQKIGRLSLEKHPSLVRAFTDILEISIPPRSVPGEN